MGLPLVEGDDGPEIADLRSRLARWQQDNPDAGEPDLEPGEVFDELTSSVLRRFQRARNLPADATVGPETWKALVEAGYRLGDRLLWHSRTIMRGDDVLDLQHRLNALGFDAGLEDGLFGAQSRDAVTEFQANAGLEVDGVVGARTVAALHRLHREHLADGVSARVREQFGLQRLARRGLVGLQVLIDPANVVVPDGGRAMTDPGSLTWAIASRLAGLLGGRGASAVLSRGPASHPDASARAQLANRIGADLVISISLNALATPSAGGAAAYYYGSLRFVSDTGRRLATRLLDASLDAGLGPDCRVHPMTWSLLRETRMPAAILEPGFVTNARDVQLLQQPEVQARLCTGVVDAIAGLLHEHAGAGPG